MAAKSPRGELSPSRPVPCCALQSLIVPGVVSSSHERQHLKGSLYQGLVLVITDCISRYVAKQGFLDLKAHDYELVLGVNVQTGLDKANRLLYGDSLMTHAMVLTGCHVENEKIVRWRVENSWGEDRGEKGYLMMTSDWFKEFVFEIVVDKNIVPASVLAVMEMEPVVLPAWDPLGALAVN